jgi:large subunit ribosomal protein L43
MSHFVTKNGLGRYVCQLKRLTLQFCSQGGSSRGLREYIDSDVTTFAKLNPAVAVYVRERRRRHPRLVGEFCKNRAAYCSGVITVKQY